MIENDGEQKKSFNPVKNIYENKVAWWLTLGASFRSLVNDAYGYFYPAFVMLMFPQKKAQFALISCVVTVASGLMAALVGSTLTSKLGQKNYAKICTGVSLFSIPCALIMMLSGQSFWLTMIM